MSRKYVFADEAGCFNFSKKTGASKYYIICTLSCESCDELGGELLRLRRDLVWNKQPLNEYFHASEDKQVVRDHVFNLLREHNFQLQATIYEKSKAFPRIRETSESFYKHAWYYHLRYAAPKFIAKSDEVQINTASVGTLKNQKIYSMAVNDVAQQIIKGNRIFRTHFARSIADPCLQAVDYCTWAIQKKWETGDLRSYDLIKHKIIHEHDSWASGTEHFYKKKTYNPRYLI